LYGEKNHRLALEIRNPGSRNQSISDSNYASYM